MRLTLHQLRIATQGALPAAIGRGVAALLLLFAAPVAAILWMRGARIRRTPRMGRYGALVMEQTLVNRSGAPVALFHALPRLVNLAKGDLGWVGPAVQTMGPSQLRTEQGRVAASMPPGIFSTWRLRQRTNVDFGSQTDIDAEYVRKRSPCANGGIILRSLLTSVYGGANRAGLTRRADILGLPLDNLSMDQAIDAIVTPANRGRLRQVSFVNVDCVNLSYRDGAYRNTLLQSALRLPDGIGLRIAGRILRSEIRQNVNGTDLFPLLLARLATTGQGLFLLGGRPGVADDVAAWAQANYPGVRIAGAAHGYFAAGEEAALIERINHSGANILLVAFGAPRQEKWIERHAGRLRVDSALGVGGLFDFYAGRIPRAPQWLRELGLEWTFRLYQEPGRMWRRYLVGNVVFLSRVMTERAKRQLGVGQIQEQVNS
jgi:N-acetylglucosaminyldiphosphoundecaprenol N-acetyl-beta-D-mannosaminyltransferase